MTGFFGFRVWEVEYSSGEIVREGQVDWKKVKKSGIIRMTLYHDGRRWDLNNKVAYFQKKRGSVVPGFSNTFQVESRTIGYYEGSQKVFYTVDELTGSMRMHVEDL